MEVIREVLTDEKKTNWTLRASARGNMSLKSVSYVGYTINGWGTNK